MIPSILLLRELLVKMARKRHLFYRTNTVLFRLSEILIIVCRFLCLQVRFRHRFCHAMSFQARIAMKLDGHPRLVVWRHSVIACSWFAPVHRLKWLTPTLCRQLARFQFLDSDQASTVVWQLVAIINVFTCSHTATLLCTGLNCRLIESVNGRCLQQTWDCQWPVHILS